MPSATQSPPKRTSMQPTRPAPSPPILAMQKTSSNGSPLTPRRSPSSPYPSRSDTPGVARNARPMITTLQSSSQQISELIPQRPAPRPPQDGARAKGHNLSYSLSSISSPPSTYSPPAPTPGARRQSPLD